MIAERVLTIRQPWADLIVAGVKDVENRTWPVPSTLPHECSFCDARSLSGPKVNHRYIGCSTGHVSPFPFRLWVHAAKQADRDGFHRALDLYLRTVGMEGSMGVLLATGTARRGVLLGSVTVTGCHPADGRSCFEDGHDGGLCSRWAERSVWHWALADPDPLPEPIPMRGRQGLWTLDLELAEPA